MQCGLHACNNLLQCGAFTEASFEAVIAELPHIEGSFFHPYRSVIPHLGNYDASVVILALSKYNIELRQHDRRRPLASLALDDQNLVGLLINHRSRGILARTARMLCLANPRHWIAILAQGNPSERVFVVIDSTHPHVNVLNHHDLMAYLSTFMPDLNVFVATAATT